jgi:hypothetical protein
MLVLRCTRKLLERLPAFPAPAVSTTVLGDWYATILMVRPAHLVLLVNERSRLPVVLLARELSTLLERIPVAAPSQHFQAVLPFPAQTGQCGRLLGGRRPHSGLANSLSITDVRPTVVEPLDVPVAGLRRPRLQNTRRAVLDSHHYLGGSTPHRATLEQLHLI